MKVKVINSINGNWYHVGEIYEVRDKKSYSSIGI